MASPNVYGAGIGGSTGPTLATSSPLMTSGFVWYVSSTTGSDAASPRGRERIRPLATLAQAHTNASARDIIVILAGHTETLTAAQTISKSVYILGEGSGSTRPRFTRQGDIQLFDITTEAVTLHNLYFPASSTTATTKGKVRTASAYTTIKGCYFEASTNDDGPQIEYISSSTYGYVCDTTIISTASAASDQPDSAIKVTNAMSYLRLEDVTLDGGTSGWANPYAFNGAAAVVGIEGLNLKLLRDSDVLLATGSTGFIQLGTCTGSARVVWTA